MAVLWYVPYVRYFLPTHIFQVAGHCLYADWFASFFVPFLNRNNSITVLPNYRLTPEHTGADILEDLDDFWTWFHSDKLSSFLTSKGISADLDYDHVLVSGESAGGYMAIMSGLTQPKGSIKALLPQYPMTAHLREGDDGPAFDFPVPPAESIDEHLAKVPPGTVVSSGLAPERLMLSMALATHNRYLDYFGHDEKLWPIGLVEHKDYLPPTWIIHGTGDKAVAFQDTKNFIEKCQKLPGVEVKLAARPGGGHGFDGELKEDEEDWLKEGLQWVEQKWLS